MSEQNQFLIEFQKSLDKLVGVRQNIQASVQMREKFSNDLKQSLTQINGRLKDLASKIINLKNSIDTLQNQVQSNTTSIDDKSQQLEALQQQIIQLENERKNAIEQFNKDKIDLQGKIDQKQQQIDELESQLRDLTTQKDSLENQKVVLDNEKNALRSELENKGQIQGERAEQITMQSEESLQRLQQQQTELTKKIDDCEAKINDLEQQLKSKEEELTKINQDNIIQQNATAESTQNLQQQIESLTKQNEDLIQRIIQTTQIINESADEFDTILKSVPNAQTQEEVNELLKQIEESIENISNALQGQGQQQSEANKLNFNTPINILDFQGNFSTTISKSELLKLLNKNDKALSKYNPSASNKYREAVEYINNLQSTNPEDITNYLKEKRIVVNKNKTIPILGGRKTKKIRKQKKKQKGGFTYNTNSKRKSIMSYTNSSRKNTKTSSRLNMR
jgi:chromosome segregation ATPase